MKVAKVTLTVIGCLFCPLRIQENTGEIEIHLCSIVSGSLSDASDRCDENALEITPTCPLYSYTKIRSYLNTFKGGLNGTEVLYSLTRMPQLSEQQFWNR